MTRAGEQPVLDRDSRAGDVAPVLAIYAHHVRNGLASFEESPPSVAEMGRRRQAVLNAGLPYLVGEVAGLVKGFACAGPYRHRPAYRNSLENTVYVDPDAEGRGLGRRLLEVLIGRCEALGYRQMLAVIGDSANHASIRLHARLGFRRVALLRSVGFKFDRWVDSVIMQRALGDGDNSAPTP